MFNSLTRTGNVLFHPSDVRLLVPSGGDFTLILRDGAQIKISANAAQDILKLVEASEILEKARQVVEAVTT